MSTARLQDFKTSNFGGNANFVFSSILIKLSQIAVLMDLKQKQKILYAKKVVRTPFYKNAASSYNSWTVK